ncbi:MAG: putative zinc-binding metallopeptidase [Muribaculaceae bacterium]|nr:putative zinc-binding metallopeptidase [Muribaculaceae bacterium]
MKLYKFLLPVAFGLALASCSEEELGPTIFPTDPEPVDPNGYTYKFDRWVEQNFLLPYNLDFKYRMEDVESSMDYNLVPATFDNARDLCLLTKYLWFDTYKEHCGDDFLKTYGPRILHLIGSPAYNPTTGTEILGLAEGGLKVTLFKVNSLDLTNINQLNEYYFRTMHHEFGHILHQTRTYPKEFDLLSAGRYDSGSWQSKPIGLMASQGFITPYASAEAREDFAETIANFLTRTDDQDELLLWLASKGWTNGIEGDDADNDDKPYYCCYYLKDVNKPDERTYFLESQEHAPGDRVGVIGMRGEVFYNVADVEAYLERLNETTPGGIFYVTDSDTVDGPAMIEQKRNIVRSWFKDTWKLNFDELRKIVQRRQNDFDIDALRAEIDAMQ